MIQCWDRIQMVRGTHQCIKCIGAAGIATGMGFLSFSKYHDLLEPNGLRMFKPKHAEPFKLAGQEPRTGTQRTNRDGKYEHASGNDPAEAMFEEAQLHSLVCCVARIPCRTADSSTGESSFPMAPCTRRRCHERSGFPSGCKPLRGRRQSQSHPDERLCPL